MTNTLVFGNLPKSVDEGMVVSRLTQLGKGEVLTVKSQFSIENTLETIRKKRLSGLKWEIKSSAPEWVFEVTNDGEADDCCGCCGD